MEMVLLDASLIIAMLILEAFLWQKIYYRCGVSMVIMVKVVAIFLTVICLIYLSPIIYLDSSNEDSTADIIDNINDISQCLIFLSDQIYHCEITRGFIATILDCVRFLFKDSAYQYEAEQRIITFATPEQIKVTNLGECFPILSYVFINSPLPFATLSASAKIASIAGRTFFCIILN